MLRPLHPPTSLLVLPLLLAVVGCGDDDQAPTSTAGGAGGGGAGGGGAGGAGGSGGAGGETLACDTASGALPSELELLAHDDGTPFSSVREQDYSIDVNGKTYVLNDIELYEAVRFELEHPARIHGFAVQWTGLPADAPAELGLTAGLYGDFGYNGFDFWAPEPLWEGSRCAGDVASADDGWLTYRFQTPVEISQPGLVYVAHLAAPQAPVFAFDENFDGAGDCALFDECQSALNLPTAAATTFFNGVSFPFPYDYLVRLYVEYTDDVTPQERFFVEHPGVSSLHASFGDYDYDGDDDLLVSGPQLFQNQGDGTFTDVTAASGLGAMGLSATGGVFGDYDNDGCLDLFVFAESYTAPDALLRSNCDGTFTDVTAASGIDDQQSYEDCGDPANVRSPSAAAAWIDIDADGLLDLYVANFICWTAGTFYTDTVFHNVGDGTFTEWTGTLGFSSERTPSRGAAPIDYDGDGDVDLFVNNYRLEANLLFENQGDGTVLEVGAARGAAGHPDGPYYGHTIGAAWGDLDGDGDFDLVAANLAHPRFFDFSDKTQVLLQQGPGTFADTTGPWDRPESAAGLRYQETHSVPALADFDSDGALDLIVTAVYDGRPTDFYWGQGDGTFVLDAYHAGITTEDGWGVALSDVDADGDVDAFVTTLFENTRPQGAWVSVRPMGGVTSNWAAIGATVRVTTASGVRLRHVEGGTGKGGQDSMALHFGLGAATEVEQISVTYPGGAVVTVDGPLSVGERYWVFESGELHQGMAPPP